MAKHTMWDEPLADAALLLPQFIFPQFIFRSLRKTIMARAIGLVRASRQHPLSALLAISLLAAPSAFASDQLNAARTRLLCDPIHSICILTSAAVDSDGDGYSDTDERAAGTDPNNPASKPTVMAVLDLIGRRELPSFDFGRTVVFVPPTLTPDGKPLPTLGVQTALEAQVGFPGRKSGLSSMGIDASLLASMGVDVGHGALVGITSFGAGSVSIGGSNGPMFVSGIRTGLISAGHENPVRTAAFFAEFAAGGPNRGKVVDSKSDASAIGHFYGQYYVGVGVDVFETIGSKNNFTNHWESHGTDGSAEENIFTQRPDGSYTNVWFKFEARVKNADGSTTDRSSESSFTQNKDGSTKNETTEKTTTTNADGTTVTVRTVAKGTVDKNGKEGTTIRTTTTTVAKDGTATTDDTESECTGTHVKTCPDYVDPDAGQNAVVLSQEEFAHAVKVIVSSNTTPGPGVVIGNPPEEIANEWDVIAFISDQGEMTGTLTNVRMWNTQIGTKKPVQGVNQPELDPAHLPGSSATDRQTAETFTGVLDAGARR